MARSSMDSSPAVDRDIWSNDNPVPDNNLLSLTLHYYQTKDFAGCRVKIENNYHTWRQLSKINSYFLHYYTTFLENWKIFSKTCGSDGVCVRAARVPYKYKISCLGRSLIHEVGTFDNTSDPAHLAGILTGHRNGLLPPVRLTFNR